MENLNEKSLQDCKDFEQQKYLQLAIGKTQKFSKVSDAKKAVFYLQVSYGDERRKESFQELRSASTVTISGNSTMNGYAISRKDAVSAMLLVVKLSLDEIGDVETAERTAEKTMKEILHSNEDDVQILSFRCKHLLALSLIQKLEKSSSSLSNEEKNAISYRALELLKEAATFDNQDYRVFYHLARHHAVRREIDEAVENVTKSIDLFDNYDPAWCLLAMLQFSRGDVEDAVNTCLVAQRLSTCMFRTSIFLAYIQHDQSQYATALQTFLKCLQSYNENPTVLITHNEKANFSTSFAVLNNNNASNSSGNGNNVNNNNSREEEEEEEETPLMKREKEMLVTLCLGAAETYLSLGKIDDAMSMIKKANKIAPSHPQPHFAMGMLYKKQNQMILAKRYSDSCLDLDIHNKNGLFLRGELRFEVNDFNSARQSFEAALKMPTAANDPSIWHWLGKALEAQGNFDAAAIAFTNAIRFRQTASLWPFEFLPTGFT